MKVYLVRHGDSVEETVDPKRPLSDQGRADAGKIGKFLATKIQVDEFYHSSKHRAKETAEILAKYINANAKISMQKGLDPMDDVESLVQELEVRSRG